MDNEKAKDFLKFQARKDVSYLYKRFLTVLEDNRDEHYFMLEKIKAAIPKQYHVLIDAANYIDDNKFALWRKRVLDAGNDTIRTLDEEVSRFNISVK